MRMTLMVTVPLINQCPSVLLNSDRTFVCVGATTFDDALTTMAVDVNSDYIFVSHFSAPAQLISHRYTIAHTYVVSRTLRETCAQTASCGDSSENHQRCGLKGAKWGIFAASKLSLSAYIKPASFADTEHIGCGI